MNSEAAQSKKGRYFGTIITNRAPHKNQASPSATESAASSRRSSKRRTRTKSKKQEVRLVDNDDDAFLKRSCLTTPRMSNASKGKPESVTAHTASRTKLLDKVVLQAAAGSNHLNNLPPRVPENQKAEKAAKKRKKFGADYLQSKKVKKMKDFSYPRPPAPLCEMPSIPEEDGEIMDCESDEGSIGSFSGSPAKGVAQFDTEFILRPPFPPQRSMSEKNPTRNKSLLSSENVRMPHRIISPKFQKFNHSSFQQLFETPAKAVATLKNTKKSTPFIETPTREETLRKYPEPAWSSWRRTATPGRKSDALLVAKRKSLESSLSPAEGKSFITRMLEEARMTPADNAEVMDAMLSTSCGVYHNGSVVGTMIGGAELQRSPSLDDSEVTIRTWDKADDTKAEGSISKQNREPPALYYSDVESACSSVTDRRPTLVAHILTSKGREKEVAKTRDGSFVKLKLTSTAAQSTPHKEVARRLKPEQQVDDDNDREKGIPTFIETPVFSDRAKNRIKHASRLQDFFNDGDFSPTSITAYNKNDGGDIESPPLRCITNVAKRYRTIGAEVKHPFGGATVSSQRSMQSSVRRDDGSIVVKLKEPSVTFSEAQQVIYFQVGDELIPHPPLPPGWRIRVSESKNRPFYCHPDHGTTWHCPVVLPRSRAPNSLRISAASSESAGSSINSCDSTSSKGASPKNSKISSVEHNAFPNATRSQQSNNFSADGDDELSTVDDQTASTAPSTVVSSPEDYSMSNPMKGLAHERLPLRENTLERHWSPDEEQDSLSSEQTLSEPSHATKRDQVNTLITPVEEIATLGMKHHQARRASIINHPSEKTNDTQRFEEQNNTDIDGILYAGDRAPASEKNGSNKDNENRVDDPDLTLTDDESKSQFRVNRRDVFFHFRQNSQPNDNKRSDVTPILPLPREAYVLRCEDMEQQKPVQEHAVNRVNKIENVAMVQAREDATDSICGNTQGSPTVEKDTLADTADFPIDSGSYSPDAEYPSHCLNSAPVGFARSRPTSQSEETDAGDSGNEEQNEKCKGKGHGEEIESSKVLARHLSISPRNISHTQPWRSDRNPEVESPMSSFGGRGCFDGTIRTAASLRIRNPPHPLCALQRLDLIRATWLAAKEHQKVTKRQTRVPKMSEKPSESCLVDPTVLRLVY